MEWLNDLLGTGESSARVQNSWNRDFEERMSNTAYQRQATDMTKAGINPIIGFGKGATTPGGSAGAGGQGGGTVTNAIGMTGKATWILGNAVAKGVSHRFKTKVPTAIGKTLIKDLGIEGALTLAAI